MPLTLISANPSFKKQVDKKQPHLEVAEMFSRTIQGEGISVGMPSVFLRLKNCTLNCQWCDSVSVWRYGNPYTPMEILDILHNTGTVQELADGHHLILTGGSPLLQQDQLEIFIEGFKLRNGFKPYIEVENECTIAPLYSMRKLVDQWNNSPKTSNSAMKSKIRYKPEIIQLMSSLNNSWFKFVISQEEDWLEIEQDFLNPGLIKRNQTILMPCGINQEELNINREKVVNLAIKHNVRFSDREHINIWDKKTGV